MADIPTQIDDMWKGLENQNDRDLAYAILDAFFRAKGNDNTDLGFKMHDNGIVPGAYERAQASLEVKGVLAAALLAFHPDIYEKCRLAGFDPGDVVLYNIFRAENTVVRMLQLDE